MLKKIGMIALGSIWSLIVFTATSPLLFPSELFEKRAEYFVQESTRGTTLIDLSELRFLGLAGLSGKLDLYKGERQRKRKRRRKAAQAAGTPPVHLFTIDDFQVRPLLFPLLTGKAMALVDLEFGEGHLEGTVGADSDALYIDLDTQGMDLASLPGIDNDAIAMDISGKANIVSDLIFNLSDPKESSGELSLSIDDLQLFNGKAKSYGFDLMPTAFTESVLKLAVEDGRASVTEGRFNGDLVEAEIEGDIILNKKLSRSRLALTIKVKILDNAMDTLLKSMSATKRARDDEGYYHFRGSGTVANPRFMPDRSKSRGSDIGNPGDDSGSANSRRSSGNRFSSDDDGATRRKKRRDRIKKRRERMKERRRKRREREEQQDIGMREDDRDEDQFEDDEPRSRRRMRSFDDAPPGNQLPALEEDLEDIEEDFPDDQEEQEELEDLGYND